MRFLVYWNPGSPGNLETPRPGDFSVTLKIARHVDPGFGPSLTRPLHLNPLNLPPKKVRTHTQTQRHRHTDTDTDTHTHTHTQTNNHHTDQLYMYFSIFFHRHQSNRNYLSLIFLKGILCTRNLSCVVSGSPELARQCLERTCVWACRSTGLYRERHEKLLNGNTHSFRAVGQSCKMTKSYKINA